MCTWQTRRTASFITSKPSPVAQEPGVSITNQTGLHWINRN